jgi:transcriptional regulator
MQSYYKSNFFQRLLGIRIITEEGLKAQKEIKRELKRIKRNTSRKTKNAVELLLAIKGNIVLIHKIPTEIFKQLEEKKVNITHSNLNTLYTNLSYAGLFHQNTIKNQFDIVDLDDTDFSPSIESVSSFSDGDFGADSGCGGCVGCGGCGGCGG